jgi:Cytochrome P460
MTRLLLLALLVGCGSAIDPEADGLTPIADYQSWQLAATIATPQAGHGDTVRLIYANPIARDYSHSGRYPIGAVLVKEVYDRNQDGTPGALLYLAIMRKVGDDAELDAPVDEGWVYSTASSVTGSESSSGACYATCHRQANHDGVWFDYGQ